MYVGCMWVECGSCFGLCVGCVWVALPVTFFFFSFICVVSAAPAAPVGHGQSGPPALPQGSPPAASVGPTGARRLRIRGPHGRALFRLLLLFLIFFFFSLRSGRRRLATGSSSSESSALAWRPHPRAEGCLADLSPPSHKAPLPTALPPRLSGVDLLPTTGKTAPQPGPGLRHFAL